MVESTKKQSEERKSETSHHETERPKIDIEEMRKVCEEVEAQRLSFRKEYYALRNKFRQQVSHAEKLIKVAKTELSIQGELLPAACFVCTEDIQSGFAMKPEMRAKVLTMYNDVRYKGFHCDLEEHATAFHEEFGGHRKWNCCRLFNDLGEDYETNTERESSDAELLD